MLGLGTWQLQGKECTDVVSEALELGYRHIDTAHIYQNHKAIGKAIAGGSRGGLIVSTALGFVGALLGPWVARMLKLPEPFMITVAGHPFPVLWSIIGAALFVALIHLFSRRGRW